jgi:THO complex subunit 2
VGDLCASYGVDPEVAFFIARPALAFLEQKTARAAKPLPPAGAGSKAGDRGGDPGAALEASQRIRRVLPESSWESISPALYATFWRLSLYDILVPRERYADEARR